jgi:hypothetical protein
VFFAQGANLSSSADLKWDEAQTGLFIGTPTITASSPLAVEHNVDGYVQYSMQNTSAGVSASSDFVATADNGTESTNYIDVGINSSGYADPAFSMVGPLDGYIYSVGGHIGVGTQTAGKEIKFHTGGTSADKLRLRVHDHGIAIPALSSSAPASVSSTLNLYCRNRAGRYSLEARGPVMKGYAIQQALYGNNVVLWTPSAGTTVSIAFGDTWTARNTTGAQSTPALAATNQVTAMKRASFNSTTAGNTGAGIQSTSLQFWRGNAANLGGFYFFARFAVEATGSLSGSAAMVGLSTLNGVLGTQTPSTLTGDYIALTKDANESTWFLSTRDNTTTTKTATGLTWATGSVYDFTMFCAPNDSKVTVRLVEYPSDTVYLNNVEITSTLPRSNTFMAAHCHVRHSGSASVASLALNRIYIESDF